jgi:parallel beta-helix repeat protein
MNSNNNGIDINGAGNLIDGNRVSKTGLIPGMGTGEASYIGINMGGSNNTVQYNQVSSTGYVAIFFLGTDNLIKNNVVQNFALVKDDGGGIYTWSGDIDTSVQRHTGIITGNIVLDGITAPNGTDKKQGAIAYGIYLDENSGMIEVSGNTVSRCKGGIFLQDAHEVTVTGNTFFDNGFQIALRNPQKKGTLRNNHISNNIAVAKSRDQFVLILSSAVSDNINGYAEFDNNRYCQPTGSQNSFFKVVTRSLSGSSTQGGSLDKWKSDYGNDKGSQIIYAGDPPRFEYNPDARPKTVNLQGSYNDISGKTYQGSISLAPFSSVLLFK